jgi:hypothetical protein
MHVRSCLPMRPYRPSLAPPAFLMKKKLFFHRRAAGLRRRPARALFKYVCWFVRRLRSIHVHAWMPIRTSKRFPSLQAKQKFKVLIEDTKTRPPLTNLTNLDSSKLDGQEGGRPLLAVHVRVPNGRDWFESDADVVFRAPEPSPRIFRAAIRWGAGATGGVSYSVESR